MRKFIIIIALALYGFSSVQAGLYSQIETSLKAVEDISKSERGVLLESIFHSLPVSLDAYELNDQQLKAFQGIMNSGLFEEVELPRIGNGAALSVKAMLQGADEEAVSEIALMAFSMDLDEKKFLSAAQSLHIMQNAGIPSEIYLQAVSYATYNDWNPDAIIGLAEGIVRGKRENIPLEKLTLALIIRVDQGIGNRNFSEVVSEEIAYIRTLQGANPERARQDSIFASMMAAVQRGVPESIAQDFYFNAVEENWSFQDADKLFFALAEGVREGLMPEKLALAFILRMEMDGGKAPVETIIKEEMEYVKQHFSLKPTPTPYIQPAPVYEETISYLDFPLMQRSIQSFVGVPYVWGGENRRGTDCSGFTMSVYREQGIIIPRISYQQYEVGSTVQQYNLEYGDLIFFNKNGWGRVNHVGIYVGDGKFAHASCSKGVTVSRLSKRYYTKRFVGGKRIAGS